MWHGKKFKPMIVGIVAAIILFVGMYVYYSIPFEIVGSVIFVIAYVAAYSDRFGTLTGLTPISAAGRGGGASGSNMRSIFKLKLRACIVVLEASSYIVRLWKVT